MTAENERMHAGSLAGSTDSGNPGLRRDGAAIGAKTQIKGDLQAEEDLLIEGRFSGTLMLRSNQLAIGAQGRIQGTAFANIVIVDGSIEGELYAAERISIRKGARVQGSIYSPRVSLEDGASLRGSVEMDPKAIQEAVKAKFGETEKPVNRPMPVETSRPAAPAAPASAVSRPGQDSDNKSAGGAESPARSVTALK